MAASFEQDLTCPVCLEVFTDPVLLPCSHSFCNCCLVSWGAQRPYRECPVCQDRSTSKPAPNLALKNLCESFRSQRAAPGSEASCSLHADRLRLFCLDDQQLACLVCRDSKRHLNHTFRPLDEAAQDLRAELQSSLQPLKKHLKKLSNVHQQFDRAADHIKDQRTQTERRIKERFAELRRFLAEEEEARIRALREEEEQKRGRMKEMKEALSRETAALSRDVRAAEEALTATDQVSFLNNYKAAMEGVRQRPLLDPPRLPPGALIDVAKHVGNLSFNIWNKMKDTISYTPLILDPNTADPDLVLSEDLTSVRQNNGFIQTVPENPERRGCYSVLSSRGFDSGSHSWEVDVTDGVFWVLGVTEDSGTATTGSQMWRLRWYDDDIVPLSSKDQFNFRLPERLQRVRVHLDCDEGTLSFTDADTNTHIHTFTHTFTHTVFPYFFCADREHPVKVLPAEVTVTLPQ